MDDRLTPRSPAAAQTELYAFTPNRNRAAAERAGHHLILPQGALVGTDALLAWRHMWRDVTITFRKHPDNIDLVQVKRRAQDITAETVIFDGTGGRLYERTTKGEELEWAHVTAYEPPHRFVLAWNPSREERPRTEIEVTFTEEGGKTRVTAHMLFESAELRVRERQHKVGRGSIRLASEDLLCRRNRVLIPPGETIGKAEVYEIKSRIPRIQPHRPLDHRNPFL